MQIPEVGGKDLQQLVDVKEGMTRPYPCMDSVSASPPNAYVETRDGTVVIRS